MAEDELQRPRPMTSEKEKELWGRLVVDFELRAAAFPDDKIYGHIQVTPESSRQLIKTFRVFVDKRNIGELHNQAIEMSASGFHSTKEGYRYAQIEAVPWWENEKRQKMSAERRFFFNGHSFYANPKISFEPSGREDLPSPATVISWYHVGDHKAHRYLLYLDEKLIQQVPEFDGDALIVRIHDLKVGDEHVLEVVATMGRDKETYRSDPLEFIVPDPLHYDVEIINLREDRMPSNLPVLYLDDADASPLEPDWPKEPFRCCDLAPHETFPGIDHYLRPIRQSPSSKRY